MPALEKALDILEYVAQHGTPITVKQIALNLELPLATTYRIVKYLCSRGYLRGETEGEYSLGPQFLYLAQVVTGQFDLISQAKPIMNAPGGPCSRRGGAAAADRRPCGPL